MSDEQRRWRRDKFYRALGRYDQDAAKDILGVLVDMGFIQQREDGHYAFPWGEASTFDGVVKNTMAMGIQVACEEGRVEMVGFDENGEPLYWFKEDV